MFFAYRHAFVQLRDPRYRRLLWVGMALSLALLIALSAVAFLIIQILVPGALFLPFVGPAQEVSAGFSLATLLYLPWLSVFLMVPVASIFTGFYLDDVADAVEAEHYRGQDPRTRVPFRESITDGGRYFGLLAAVNLVGMAVFAISSGWGIAILWALNGFLLSREYFTMIARRRNDRDGARDLFKRDFYWLWLPGVILAIGLSIPILNLLMPLVGAAVFTHMYHRLHPEAAANPA